MKYLLRYLVFALMLGCTSAQSNLPACPSFGVKNNCFGTNASSNSKYEGEWLDGKYHGVGTLIFYVRYVDNLPWSGKYVGEFKDGKFNGQGTLYAPNGQIINQGLWTENKFIRSMPLQPTITNYIENERLREETENAKRKQTELENRLRPGSLCQGPRSWIFQR